MSEALKGIDRGTANEELYIKNNNPTIITADSHIVTGDLYVNNTDVRLIDCRE